METTDHRKANSSRLGRVFTDVHFWVPVAVFLAGLQLWSSMH